MRTYTFVDNKARSGWIAASTPRRPPIPRTLHAINSELRALPR